MTWRDVLKIHPAADLFPMMSRDELIALGEDIKANGMKTTIVVLATPVRDCRGARVAMNRAGFIAQIKAALRTRAPRPSAPRKNSRDWQSRHSGT